MAGSLLVGANECLGQGILKVVVAPGLFSSSVRLFNCPRLGAHPSHHRVSPLHLQPQHAHFVGMSIWTDLHSWYGFSVAKGIDLEYIS